jgi:hypothetical protein
MAEDYLAVYRELTDAALGTFDAQRVSAGGKAKRAKPTVVGP